MFSALSENLPFFKQHLSLFIALAPVVKLENCTSGIIKKMSDNEIMEKTLLKLNMHEIFPASSNRKASAFFHKLCPELNKLGIKLLSDENPKEID
jgi:hypothetical protein